MIFTVKPLGELCVLTMGRTPPRGNSIFWDASRNTKNIWISIADMTKCLDGTLTDSKEYLSDVGSKIFPKVKVGTLLMSFKLSIGKLAIAGVELQTNEAIVSMNELNEDLILRDYLYYFLFGYDWSEALEGRFKVKGNTLNKKILEALLIKFPPIEIQREIVEKLDGAFAEIDLLDRNLGLGDEKANQLLQSLLSSAFSPTADEYKSSNASVDDLISTNLVPLGTVAEVIAGQSPEGIYYNSNGDGVPFYQGKKEFGDKLLGAPTTWTTKITKLAQSGDILMSVRAPVGPINFSTQEICIGRGLASIRASKLVNKNFLFYFLLHKQPEISGNTGAVFDSINKDQIASIELPVPSLEKQQEIVDKLDSAFAEIELLKAQIRTEKECALALRQSLLSSAFTPEESVA